jgi:hypothetical protein
MLQWWCGAGWNTRAYFREIVDSVVGLGSARCWVLRRHLLRCFFWLLLAWDHLTRLWLLWGLVGVVVVVVGWGVVVC